MSASPSSEKPSIALPIVALVCVLVCWPVGLILSIIAFVKNKENLGTEARTLSIVALVANVVLVVPAMGCAAAIAIPNFVKFQCRSKQSEAKGNLKALYVAQESHRAEKDTYSTDPTALGFQPMGQKIRYQYVVLDASKEAFHAEARGIGEMEGDLWTIDNANTLKNVTSTCGFEPSQER